MQSLAKILDKRKALAFVTKGESNSYFADCPRDDKGHCKASGQSTAVTTDIDSLVSSIKEKFPNVKLELYKKTSHKDRNVWDLSKIIIPPEHRGQGVGSAVMQEIVSQADKDNATITLDPSTDFGASSKKRLIDFYSQFGFKLNKGRHRDLSLIGSMIRTPQSKQKRFKSVTAAKRPQHSYFNDCERDDKGHCKPKGAGSSSASKETSVPKETQVSSPTQQKAESKTKAYIGKAREILDKFPGAKWMQTKTKQLTNELEKRYGKKQALAIVASGQVIGWGISVVGTAATGAPVWIPFSTVIGMVPGAALAEIHYQMMKRKEKAMEPEQLSEEKIQKLGKRLVNKLLKEWKEHHMATEQPTELLRNNPAIVKKGIDGEDALSKLQKQNDKLAKEKSEFRFVPALDGKITKSRLEDLNEMYGNGWQVWIDPSTGRLAIATKQEMADSKKGAL